MSSTQGHPASQASFGSEDYDGGKVDFLITKFERVAEKQMAKAQETCKANDTDDISTVEKEFLKPSFVSAELSLMSVAGEVRDVCAKAVLGTTAADRGHLDDVFGRGCECRRFHQLKAIKDKVKLSKLSETDARWNEVSSTISTIEKILEECGSFRGLPKKVASPSSATYPDARPFDSANGAGDIDAGKVGTFAAGDPVQIWSDSKKLWVDGTVEAVGTTDGAMDDRYEAVAGTLKVRYHDGALKYVTPDKIPATVKARQVLELETLAPLPIGTVQPVPVPSEQSQPVVNGAQMVTEVMDDAEPVQVASADAPSDHLGPFTAQEMPKTTPGDAQMVTMVPIVADAATKGDEPSNAYVMQTGTAPQLSASSPDAKPRRVTPTAASTARTRSPQVSKPRSMSLRRTDSRAPQQPIIKRKMSVHNIAPVSQQRVALQPTPSTSPAKWSAYSQHIRTGALVSSRLSQRSFNCASFNSGWNCPARASHISA